MHTKVWFARHGEVEAPYVGTFVGKSDVQLSDVGHHQAAAIAKFLEDAPVDAVISSPRLRAVDTAKPLAKALGGPPEVRSELAEMDFGQWECLSWPDIERRDLEFARRWQQDPASLACPGGESAGQFAARSQAAMHDVLEEFAGRSIAVFGHAGSNRAFLSMLTGMAYMDAFVFAQDYGCLNAAAWDSAAGHGQLALMNLVPGPQSQAHGDGGRRVA